MNKFFSSFLVYALILFFFNSCEKKNNISESKINISDAFKTKERINLSELVSDLEYIQLETDGNSHINQIRSPHRNVRFHKNNIIINDISGQLLLFDITGKFKNKIGNIGRGPEEYSGADSFTFLDNGKDNAVVYSAAQKKAFVYNLDGTYIKSFNIDFWPSGIIANSNNLLFINPFGVRSPSNYNAISAISSDGLLLKQLLHKENERVIEKDRRLALTDLFNVYNHENNMYFWESNYDTLWKIDNELNLSPKYLIEMEGKTMPLAQQTDVNVFNFETYSQFDRIENIQETNKFLFFNTVYQRYRNTIFHDKISGESVNVQYDDPSGGKHFAFFNDIDGGVPFWPDGKVTDNKMFMISYGYEIRSYFQEKNNQNSSIERSQQLPEFIKNSKPSDNPVLVIATFKDDTARQ